MQPGDLIVWKGTGSFADVNGQCPIALVTKTVANRVHFMLRSGRKTWTYKDNVEVISEGG